MIPTFGFDFSYTSLSISGKVGSFCLFRMDKPSDAAFCFNEDGFFFRFTMTPSKKTLNAHG